MALKSDVAKACKQAGTYKPVDLVHLSSQTMGDRMLEAEVLDVFLHQSLRCADRLQTAENSKTCREVAHTLKGAARGIGAWDLAALCEEAERTGISDNVCLQEEIDRVCNYIRELLKA